MARMVHESQGSLLDGFPEDAEPIDDVEPIAVEDTPVLPSDEIVESTMAEDTTVVPSPETVVPIEVAKRAESLYKVIGHLANLSKTGIYETIEEKPGFQRHIERTYPGRAQAHIEKVLLNRGEISKAAKTDFKIAYGVDELAESGLVTKEQAEQMADDFYEGTNGSGYNPDNKSFGLSYADSRNHKKRLALRKVLKKQSPRLK